MKKKRIVWLDAVRGWAIILVILGHTDISKMNKEIFTWIYSFHIPLFFIISGMVFSIKEVKYTKFLKNKVITLLVPYIVFRIIEIMFGMIYSTMLGSSITYIDIRNRVVGLFLQSRGTVYESGLWFLTCLFLMQNVMYYIEKIKIKRIKYICIASIVCIGILYQIFVNKPLPWYIEILFTCFIFIYLGYYMKNIIIKDKTGGYIHIIILTSIHLFTTFLNFKISGHSTDLYWNCYGNFILFYIAALSGAVVWILIFKKLYIKGKLLAYIGKNSLIFYVLHQNIIMPICGKIFEYIVDYQKLTYIKRMGYFGIETIMVCMMIVPCAYIINKFFPFIVGKSKK